MRKHLKRNMMPKNWPIPRKGTKFIVKQNSKGIPVLIVLREMMNLAQNRREVKKAIHQKNVLINQKIVRNEKKSLELFDILTIVPEKKDYRLELSSKGKYEIKEINLKMKNSKISKIIGKKSLKGKKIQINLADGKNYLSSLKCKIDDSALIDLKKKVILEVLPVKEKAEVLVIGGKHSGSLGKIKKLIPELKMAEVDEGTKIVRVLIKQLMVIQSNGK